MSFNNLSGYKTSDTPEAALTPEDMNNAFVVDTSGKLIQTQIPNDAAVIKSSLPSNLMETQSIQQNSTFDSANNLLQTLLIGAALVGGGFLIYKLISKK